MINKAQNDGTVSGKLYGFGRFGLEKIEKDGEIKIRGSINVLTDEVTNNVVEVNFLPQSPTYKSGKTNNNFKVLEKIINAKDTGTVEAVGVSKAISVRMTASLSTNPYYTKEETEADGYRLVEPFQIKGNFIHIDDAAKPYCGFNVDCLIKDITDGKNSDGVEDGSKVLKVDVFDDYRQFFFPLTLQVEDMAGASYISTTYSAGEKEDATYATLTIKPVSTTVEVTSSEEMGFGESAVTTQRSIRKLVVIGAKPPKEEVPMTEEDWTKVAQNRIENLATAKNRAIEKSKDVAINTTFGDGNATATTGETKKTNEFNF